MSKPNMTCRICGKEYFCCSDSKNMGAWKSVSCSPECYKEYMKRIEESRKPQNASKKVEGKIRNKKNVVQEDATKTQTDYQLEKIDE